MNAFSLKIRCENFQKSNMTYNQKLDYCSELNRLMNFHEDALKLTPEILQPNMQLRHFLKTLQNMILGYINFEFYL